MSFPHTFTAQVHEIIYTSTSTLQIHDGSTTPFVTWTANLALVFYELAPYFFLGPGLYRCREFYRCRQWTRRWSIGLGQSDPSCDVDLGSILT